MRIRDKNFQTPSYLKMLIRFAASRMMFFVWLIASSLPELYLAANKITLVTSSGVGLAITYYFPVAIILLIATVIYVLI